MMNGLVGNVDFPKWVEDETEASELGENVTATQIDPESTIFSMSPSRLAVFGQISKQLLKQTSTDVEGWLRNYLMFKMSARMDRAAIEKILALTGAGVVIGGTNGGAPTWDSLVDLETEVAIDNADIGKLGYLTNPRVQGKLKKTKLDDGSGQFVWNRGAKTLNEYNVGITNQIPSDLTKGTANSICSAMIFGNFSDLICGQWGGFDVTVDGLTGAKTGMINIVTETFYDIAVAREQSFAVMKDILTT